MIIMTTQTITDEIKKAIEKLCLLDPETGRKMIHMGNCRLDFSKPYFFNGFTKKGVKMSYSNGGNQPEVNVIGKIEYNDTYKDFAFYTEGWNYIEHLKIEGVIA